MKEGAQADRSVSRKIPSLDLNQWAFHSYHGNPPDLVTQGGRVIGLFNADNAFYEITERYNNNEDIPVMDFVREQRKMRARMMALKESR
jgi:hypothetical protein